MEKNDLDKEFKEGILYMGTLVKISELVDTLKSRYANRQKHNLNFLDDCLKGFLEEYRTQASTLENIHKKHGFYLDTTDFQKIIGCSGTFSDVKSSLQYEFNKTHKDLAEYVAYSNLK